MNKEDQEECPTHGLQSVVGADTTGGSDPYNVAVLSCRCGVTSFGPGEPNVVIHVYPKGFGYPPMPTFSDVDLENDPSPNDWLYQ